MKLISSHRLKDISGGKQVKFNLRENMPVLLNTTNIPDHCVNLFIKLVENMRKNNTQDAQKIFEMIETQNCTAYLNDFKNNLSLAKIDKP